MMPERITVASVCDNHYIVLLAALAKSVEKHHKSPEPIDFYIVNDHISVSNKLKFLNSFSSNIITFHWIELTTLIPEDEKLPLDRSFFPANIYGRLFLPKVMPLSVKKFIYLDVDMIFKADISELWATNIASHTIAAVQDKSGTAGNSWAGIKNYKELKLDKETKYFNSGLLIIDTEKWLNANVTTRVLKCISENVRYANFPDQYGLNIVFSNNWFELDKRWNCQSRSKCDTPFVIHFTGRKPIYTSYNTNLDFQSSHKEEFYKNLHETKWQNFKSISEFGRILQKLRIQYNKRFKHFHF